MTAQVINLSRDLAKNTFKRGRFLLSTKKISKYWVDLYSLSHLFNASENANDNRNFLATIMKEIIMHQYNNLGINSIIVSRWTRCTEDQFSETMLNICFQLLKTELKDTGIRLYELFSAGGNTEDYYLNQVVPKDSLSRKQIKQNKTNAVAFLALDIHSWIIDNLLISQNKLSSNVITVQSVISVLGRCVDEDYPRLLQRNRKTSYSDFLLFPLFNATGYDPQRHIDGYSYLLDSDSNNSDQVTERLYNRYFVDRQDCENNNKFIPIL